MKNPKFSVYNLLGACLRLNMHKAYSRTMISIFVLTFVCLISFYFNDEDDSGQSSHKVPCLGCGHSPFSCNHSKKRLAAGQIITGKKAINVEEIDKAVSQAETFRDWSRIWYLADESNKQKDLTTKGLELAVTRRAAMEILIQNDPDAALDHALGYAEYAALPDEIRALVEQPFSESGLIEVQINCFDENGSKIRHIFEDSKGHQYRLSISENQRVELTKRNLPVQGIKLGGMAAVRGQVFQVMESSDAAFVASEWPLGQRNPNLCFSTGEPIQGVGLTAVAGGKVFRFQDMEELSKVESVLRKADELVGTDTGSSWLMKAIEASGLDQFPIAQFTAESQEASYASAIGAKTAFFIMIDFSDKPGQPVNPSTLEQVIDINVNDGLNRYSYSQTSMNATVASGTYRVPNVSSSYGNYDTLYTHALAAYMASNPDPRLTYDTVGIFFVNIGYTWAGLATVGGQKMWLQNTTNAEVILHEFGHNYGLSHANYWVPTNTNPVDPAGATEGYGDVYDVMGDGNVIGGHFNPAAKAFLNWIPSSDLSILASATDNGTYRVYRFDHQSSTGNRGLRITKSATSDFYWVGYRQDYAQLDSFANGAYLVWENGNTTNNQCWLLDTTPGSSGGKADAPVTLGRTYSDTASNVHITPVGVGGVAPNQFLDVQVNFGSFPGNTSPSGTLIAPSAVNAREKILFTVNASDANGDTLAYSWNMGDGVVKKNTASIAHSWIQGGTYNISVTVSDMKGGTTTLTKTVTVTDPLNTWSTRTSGTTNDLNSIACNSTHVVAVGSQRILRSSDGSSWSNVSPGSGFGNVHLYSVCWTGSEFVACGMDYDFGIPAWEGVVFKSTDGLTWTRHYETNLAGTELNSITSDGSGIVVAVGNKATVRHRTAAGVWSTVTTTVTSTHTLQDVAYGGGKFVFVGHATTPTYNGNVAVYSSTDGLSWTNYSSGSGLDSWKDYRSIYYNGKHFVASGFYSRVCYSLNLGQTWQTNQTGDTHNMEAYASGAGLVYAVGVNLDASDADVDLVSTDGKTWTVINPGVLSDRNGLTFFKNTFISVGVGGTIRQSNVITPLLTYADFAETHFPGGGNNALPSANPDGDRADNLTEFALGSNPTLSSSAPSPAVFSINISGIPVFEVPRASRRGDVAYSVWWSTNLNSWTRSGLTTEIDSDILLKVVADGQDLSGGKGFFRLRIDQ